MNITIRPVSFSDSIELEILVQDFRANVTLNHAETMDLKEDLIGFRKRELTAVQIQGLAEKLKGLLPIDWAETGLNRDSMIELTSEPPNHPILSNIPWELVQTKGNANEANTSDVLGYAGLSRLYQFDNSSSLQICKPRVQLCITSPPPEKDLSIDPYELEVSLSGLMGAYSFLDFEITSNQQSPPSKAAILEAVKLRRPHVFILVAHGVHRNGNSHLLIRDEEPVPLNLFADELMVNNHINQCLLICCDLAVEPSGSVSSSAATAFLSKGVREVVAMNGDIAIGSAEKFVGGYLESLLRSGNSLFATRDGRSAIAELPDAAKPALFINQGPNQYETIKFLIDGYRNKYCELINKTIGGGLFFKRKKYEEQIGQLLRKKGLALINGVPGCGTTSTFKSAYQELVNGDELLPPVFYVDLEGMVTITETIKAIYESLNAFPELLPVNRFTEKITAREIMDDIDRGKFVLVLDHFPTELAPVVDELWNEFFNDCSTHLKDGLVVVISPSEEYEIQTKTNQLVELEPFNIQELQGYVLGRQTVSADFNWEGLHVATGGIPLLINFEMHMYNTLERDYQLPDQYAEHILRIKDYLKDEEFIAWLEMASFDGGLSMDFIQDFTSLSDRQTLQRFVDMGLMNVQMQGGKDVFIVPSTYRQLLLDTWHEIREDIETAYDNARNHFINWSEMELEKNPKALAAIFHSTSGFSFLNGIQRVFDANRQDDAIESIPELCHDGTSNTYQLISLYQNAIDYLGLENISFKAKVSYFGLLVDLRMHEAIDVSLDISCEDDIPDLAEMDLPDMENEETIWLYCRYLKSFIQYLKDRCQHAAIDRIEKGYAILFDTIEKQVVSAQANKSKWLSLKADALNNFMAFKLFLLESEVDEAYELANEIATLEGQKHVHALSLCQIAELLINQENPDWEKSLENCLQALEILHEVDDPDNPVHLITWSYCHYQWAQWFRKKDSGEWQSAEENYRKSMKYAQTFGSNTRTALAQLRILQLQSKYDQDAKDDMIIEEAKKTKGLIELEGDSLSSRILVRLCELLAQVDDENREDHLYEACQFSARKNLTGKSDLSHRKRNFKAYLENLMKRAATSKAQIFVTKYKSEITDLTGRSYSEFVQQPWEIIPLLN